jgi:hypothetical protein
MTERALRLRGPVRRVRLSIRDTGGALFLFEAPAAGAIARS